MLPPTTGRWMQSVDYDCATRSLCVELHGGGEYVGYERGADPKTAVAQIYRETADQQRWKRVGRLARDAQRRSRAVDRGHCDGGVGHDCVIDVGDDPGGSGVATPVLSGIPA